MKPTLLLIDDDLAFMNDFALLRDQEFHCLMAPTPVAAQRLMRERSPDLILLDLMLGEGLHGLDVIKDLQQVDHTVPIVIFTDFASIDTAVEAIKAGASDYLPKTASVKELRLVIEKSLRQRLALEQRQTLENEIGKPFDELIGDSAAMNDVREKILLFSMTDNNVLIIGESGVGKELVARHIHRFGKRKMRPFVAVNCPAIPAELVESELFGHEKGAFTGATQRRIGKFELAADGTIFLDEVADLALDAQVKLLRVLQEREFSRIGGAQTIRSHARVIAATNKNLLKLVEQERFREDLYYRLNVLPIVLSPLRDRPEDIVPLVRHMIAAVARDLKVITPAVEEPAFSLLRSYAWPGNVRELQNVLSRMLITRAPELPISAADVDAVLGIRRDEHLFAVPQTWEEMDGQRRTAMQKAGRDVERRFLEQMLKQFNGNVSQAAKHIGINRNNLHKLMRKNGITGFRAD